MKKTTLLLAFVALLMAGCAKSGQKDAMNQADSTALAADSVAAEADAILSEIDTASQEVDQLIQEL